MTPAARRALIVIGLVALPILGAAAGRYSAPVLARSHYLVQVAERLYVEESMNRPERTLQTEAIRTLGVPREQVYREARQVRERFDTGSMVFGFWCGLVIAATLIAWMRQRGRQEYEIDAAWCVECARCYKDCPIEHKRRKERGPA